MDYKKILLATLGGTVVLYFLGYAIWGFGLDGIHRANTETYEGLRKAMPNMPYLVLSMAFTAFLMSYIFDRWAGISTFKGGAKAGALIATLIGLGHDFLWLSMNNLFNETVMATNIVGNLVWGALGGGVIAWILGRGNND